MKLIKKPMTLEQYEAKYPHYQTKLISFSDNEIKEFNNKFHKANGKDIPNKYALLEKYKWVHIKDRYYQIPRVSKLGKAGIGLVGAAAIACAVVLPLTLNKSSEPIVNVTEDEFKANLLYLYNNEEDRKFACKGKINLVEHKGDPEFIFDTLLEVDGFNTKWTKSMYGETIVDYQYFNEDDESYYYYDTNAKEGPQWVRQPNGEVTLEDNYICGFKSYSELFSKATKINGNTYKIENVDADNYIKKDLKNRGTEIKSSNSTVELTFNEDKTIKSIKDYVTVVYIDEDSNKEVTTTQNTDVEYYDLGNHKIEDMTKFKKAEKQDQVLTYSNNYHNYYADIDTITEDVPLTINVTITSDEPSNDVVDIDKFYITYSASEFIGFVTLSSSIIEPIIYKPLNGKQQEWTKENNDYSIDNDTTIVFNNKSSNYNVGDVLTIKINPKANYDYCTVVATPNIGNDDLMVNTDVVEFDTIAAEPVQYFVNE